MEPARSKTTPRLPPELHIPASQNTVEVFIIDTTSFMTGFPASSFVDPIVPGFDTMNGLSYSYMIRHKSNTPQKQKYDTLLFDLGVRKDWETQSPEPFVRGIKEAGILGINVEKDVADILTENGEELEDVGAIIWSHWHFDHTGDPTRFPRSTDLIVGPGFRECVMPGHPTDWESHVDSRAWEGRRVFEVDFGSGGVVDISVHADDSSSSSSSSSAAGAAAAAAKILAGDAAATTTVDGSGLSPLASAPRLQIGQFHAIDFYGDGSFYLLDSPGHAVGHMSALARTTPAGTEDGKPATFILLGGDIAHHAGEFRPSPYMPMPETLEGIRDPRTPRMGSESGGGRGGGGCPGALFMAIHPRNDPEMPFFDPTPGGALGEDGEGETWHHDAAAAKESIVKMMDADAHDCIFPVMAHDMTLGGTIELYPRRANEWMSKGWKDKTRWRFLESFDPLRGGS